MSLSAKSFQVLAEAITPRVAQALFDSEAWVDFLHTEIPGLVDKELGEMDDDLLVEMSLAVMDRISLKVNEG